MYRCACTRISVRDCWTVSSILRVAEIWRNISFSSGSTAGFDRLASGRKPDLPDELRKTRVGADPVPSRIALQPHEPVRSLSISVIEAAKDFVLLSETGIDDRDGVARGIPALPGESTELREQPFGVFPAARLRVEISERSHRRRPRAERPDLLKRGFGFGIPSLRRVDTAEPEVTERKLRVHLHGCAGGLQRLLRPSVVVQHVSMVGIDGNRE